MDKLVDIIDRNLVKQLIPQREPIVMVDALYEYTETSITAGLTIDEHNLCVNSDVLREVGIIEHMAQSVALHTGYQFHLRNEPAPVGYIGSIKKIDIHNLPKVGDTIYTKVDILQEFMGVTLVELVTYCERVVIASGSMKTVLAKEE
ncbi:hypothetical protein HMPREF9711_01693 [Myroides odoratimimus CCUG 3837]|uniref:hypothetical protein n=1 Tax=Myroides odoratimimus TaxID=76832 RepID=UPI000280A64A|nr:hypothetical protein [Myroides odoratimimus]EKB04828.1 hypothetical protein HMPREF9711_01693 [Myroides odoratimimus CCUG 3837]